MTRPEAALMTERRDEDRCVVCHGAARPRYAKGPARYWECRACGALFQHPLPDASLMQQFAETEYSGGVYQEYVQARPLKCATFRRRLDLVRRHGGRGRLLDVGCACGYLLDVALETGYDAHGIEFSAAAIAQASAVARPRIRQGNVDELGASELGEFDVVTAFDIVEHSLAPLTFLHRVHGLLRPGGWLVLTTPDVHHPLRFLMGRRWPMLQPLQHTVLFSRRSLRLALDRAGFDVIRIEPARKCLTVDYLATQIAGHNPVAHRLYRVVAPAVPRALRSRPIAINIGEMLALARRRS
jgi:SAM-dependent methyltransferase